MHLPCDLSKRSNLIISILSSVFYFIDKSSWAIIFVFQVSSVASEERSVDFLLGWFFGDTEQMEPNSVIGITYLLMTYLI